MVKAPSEALGNEAAAAESIAADVQAPTDEVAEAIAELEVEPNVSTKKAAPAKKARAKKAGPKAPPHKPRELHARKVGRRRQEARAVCRRERVAEAAKAAKA